MKTRIVKISKEIKMKVSVDKRNVTPRGEYRIWIDGRFITEFPPAIMKAITDMYIQIRKGR